MKLNRLGRLFFMLALPLACGLSDESEWNEDTRGHDANPSGITNGTQTSGYPSVGSLTSGSVWCSATLIGARTVLTAAHCIESASGKFNVGGGSRAWSKAHVHSGYDARSLNNDLAVVILDSAVTSVTPSPLNASPVSKGQAITLVGYGYTTFSGGNDAGKKYVGTNTISNVGATWLEYKGNSNNCSGDSGGPSFIGSKLVGVHSSGEGNKYCSTTGYDVRVEPYVAWIKSKAADDLGGGGGGTGAAQVAMSKSTYAPNEPIVVSFSNLPGNAKDWIGIYGANAPDASELSWKYTNGARSGSLTFAGMQAGNYQARLFFNDNYTRQGQAPFVVQGGAPPPNPGPADYKAYFGYLHAHTSVSDGTGTPAQAFAKARSQGLDFFGISDHDYWPDSMTSADWATIKNAANQANQDGQFATFWGFEWTSDTTQYQSNGLGQGHVTVVNSDDFCSSSDSGTRTLNQLVQWLSSRNAIALFNHPGQYNTNFGNYDFNKSDKFVGMELWNRSEDYYSLGGHFDKALQKGWYIGAAGGQDNHSADWGSTNDWRIAVLATEKTRASILSAFQARRTYSSREKNLMLSFTCNDAQMGSRIGGGTLSCRVETYGGNNESFSQIDLVKNGSVIKSWTPTGARPVVTQSVQAASGDYLYARVFRSNRWAAISSPIFISSN